MGRDPYDMATASLFRAAGDDIAAFLGEPAPDPVGKEEQLAAAMVIRYELARGDPELAYESLDEIIAAAKGQAFESYWRNVASKIIHDTDARIALLSFMESVCGRVIEDHE